MEEKDSQGYTESQRLAFLKQIASSYPQVQALYMNSSQDASSVMEGELIKIAKNFEIHISAFQQKVGEIAQKIAIENGEYNG